MKKIINLFACLALVLFAACTSDDALVGEMGYLTLSVNAVSSTHTRAVPQDYNPRCLAVAITDMSGKVIQSTDDFSKWEGQQLALFAGKYIVIASSNGWDGNDSGRDIPYYMGRDTVTITAKTKSDATIVCTLANVKVSVQFDQTISDAFTSATVEVTSAVNGIEAQAFEMGNTALLKPAYFPVGNLSAKLTVVNKAGQTHSMETPIKDVKARDHYILKYSTSGTGNGTFNITASDDETEYTYNFDVPTQASTVVKVSEANAWSTFAYLQGSIPTAVKAVVDENVKMQYKKAADNDWTEVGTTKDGDLYKVTLKDLTPGTEYAFKMVYNDGTDTFESAEKAFTTEERLQLPNSTLDDWYNGKVGNFSCWYPTSEDYVSANGYSFWGTSNAGTSILNKAVTEKETNDVHTAGGNAAKLGSQYVVIKFAAASLFAGEFLELVGTSGGKINFGQPFAARPTQFKGWYKYSTGAINRVGTLPNYITGITKGTTPDTWACFVALMTEQFVYDNSTTEKASSKKYVANGTMPDFENDDRCIAYGEMPMDECGAQADWKQFCVDLKYRDLTKKPAYIVIVISSSRYGDFFTGYDKATLLVDDLSLEYGEPNK